MDTTTVGLDTAQRAVVDHEGGPLLVCGGPGTGKTTVLVERWVRLATERIEPHRVLLLVPTRDRALTLRDELPWRLDRRAVVEVPVHTWHAFAYHLVTRYHRLLGYQAPPVRLTTAEQWSVVRDLLASEDTATWGDYADHLRSDAFVAEVADFCIRAGHRGLTDEDLQTLAADRPEHAAVARFAVRYRRQLTATSTLDYPSLIVEATRLLRDDDDIRAALHRRFVHVLVDDGQELAPAQLRLLERLRIDDLVCAGDPDSAIEAFRGADPSWLERFEQVAPEASRVTLPTVHRFGTVIGDVCASLISHAPDGEHRPTSYAGPGDGTAIVRTHATMAGEIEAAARTVRAAHVTRSVPYDRMAILMAQPAVYVHPVSRMLESLGVPYRIDSGDRPLGAEPAVAAVLDLCRVALLDEVAPDVLTGVLASPLVGLHPYQVRDLRRTAYTRDVALDAVIEDDPDLEAFRALRDLVRSQPSEPADATFQRLFQASSWCLDLAARRHRDREATHHTDALVALSKALAHFVERRPGGTMREYLESSAESGVAPDRWNPTGRRTGVHLLSLHASKGLEWDVVVVCGAAEGQIPKAHRAQGLFDPWAIELGSAVDRAQAQLAEERRTMYVAMTRARRELVVSASPGTRRSTPSRFVDEAFGEVPEPAPPDADQPPLTLGELTGSLRRTIAATDASDAQRAAATAALSLVPGVDPASWWWRRAYTPGQPLTPEGVLTTSYSRIGTYDNCPLQYVLHSVLGLDPESTYQMKFGTLMHDIFERADPSRNEIPTLEDAAEIYRTAFLEMHRDDYPNLAFARTYYTFGIKALKRWWASERSADETIAVEYSFNDLDFDGHTIRGRIDRVSRRGNGIVLSDYKTSRNAIPWQEAKESLQLAIYYHAARTYDDLRTHGDPLLMQLVYPGIAHEEDGVERCATRRQFPKEADAALDRLRGILTEAASERFDPSPEADCQWCRMKPLCPRWPEGREIPR